MTEHRLRLRDQRADVELVRSAREGDDAAFEALYLRHLAALERFCTARHGLSRSEAKCVIGECLLRGVYSFDTSRDTPFVEYVRVAVKNAIRSDHRSSVTWRRRFQRAVTLRRNGDPELDDRPGPEDLAADECARVRAALDELPPVKRAVVQHVAVDGTPPDEVAEELGLTRKQVDNIYQQAKRDLCRLLPDEMWSGRSHRHRRRRDSE